MVNPLPIDFTKMKLVTKKTSINIAQTNFMEIKSHISIAKMGVNSLRTTIPQATVSHMQLAPGDEVEWVLGSKGSDRIAIITKVFTKTKSKSTKRGIK